MAKTNQRRPAPNERDTHHLLYTRRTFCEPWAHKLREHPYLRVRVPRAKVHQEIHDLCPSIPPPPEWVCEAVWHELNYLFDSKLINKHDNIVQRLFVIIEELNCYDDERTKRSVEMLKVQRQIVLDCMRG